MAGPAVRLLIIQANPPDTERIDTGVEQRKLDDALRGSLNNDRFEVHPLLAARIQDVAETLRRYTPHIIHFAVHGEEDGSLLLNAPNDEESMPIAAQDLAEMVRLHQTEAVEPVRLAVLAGCYTVEAAALLRPYVDCAIGMRKAIGDNAVKDVFTPAFYAALGDGRSVANATWIAVNALRSHHYDDDAEMVTLHVRDGVDAKKLMFTKHPTRLMRIYVISGAIILGIVAVVLAFFFLMHLERQRTEQASPAATAPAAYLPPTPTPTPMPTPTPTPTPTPIPMPTPEPDLVKISDQPLQNNNWIYVDRYVVQEKKAWIGVFADNQCEHRSDQLVYLGGVEVKKGKGEDLPIPLREERLKTIRGRDGASDTLVLLACLLKSRPTETRESSPVKDEQMVPVKTSFRVRFTTEE